MTIQQSERKIIEALKEADDLLIIGPALEFQDLNPKSISPQELNPDLSIFDTIFLNFSLRLPNTEPKKEEKKSHPLVARGKKLMAKIEKRASFLKTHKHTDADIDAFFTSLTKKRTYDSNFYLNFFTNLEKKGNITNIQLERVITRLLSEKLITHKTIERFQKLPFDFFALFEQCLSSHMRPGSRFIAHSEAAPYENKQFLTTIIENPHLDYKEEQIDEILLITITKL